MCTGGTRLHCKLYSVKPSGLIRMSSWKVSISHQTSDTSAFELPRWRNLCQMASCHLKSTYYQQPGITRNCVRPSRTTCGNAAEILLWLDMHKGRLLKAADFLVHIPKKCISQILQDVFLGYCHENIFDFWANFWLNGGSVGRNLFSPTLTPFNKLCEFISTFLIYMHYSKSCSDFITGSECSPRTNFKPGGSDGC